jgi:hypothetical protein
MIILATYSARAPLPRRKSGPLDLHIIDAKLGQARVSSGERARMSEWRTQSIIIASVNTAIAAIKIPSARR